MISRRDFLKSLTSLPFIPFLKGDERARQDVGFDLVSAFASLQDGDVLEIPSGNYEVPNELTLNKDGVIIYWNNANVYPHWNFAPRPVLNMHGAKNCRIHDLRIHSHNNAALPVCGLALGRSETSHGAGNTFYNPHISGNYTGASVYNTCSEANSFIGGNFQTETNKPAFINSGRDILNLGFVESSNCLMYIDKCVFSNYGSASYAVLLYGFVSGMTVRDSFMFVGNGAGFRVESEGYNHNHSFVLDNIRCEGSGRDSLLIDNVGEWGATWDISRINWAVFSDFIIRSNHTLYRSRLDFTFAADSYADKWLHLSDGAQLEAVQLLGDWEGKIG